MNAVARTHSHLTHARMTFSAAGQPITPMWAPNPKPQPTQMCKEATQISSPESISISFV